MVLTFSDWLAALLKSLRIDSEVRGSGSGGGGGSMVVVAVVVVAVVVVVVVVVVVLISNLSRSFTNT